MEYTVAITTKFKRELKRLSKKYRSVATEYTNLVADLKENPMLGTPLGNDCYKIRLAIASRNKGKSGGSRVITYVYVAGEIVFLLSIYDKSNQESITDEEIKKLVETLGL